MREPGLTNRHPRSGLLIAGAMVLGVALCGTRVQAQSLDEQYTFYLSGKCAHLNFARDTSFDLLPGQAGPHLQAFCSGPPTVAGGIQTTSVGGGATGETGSAEGVDRALKRRRSRLKSDSDPQAEADSATDSELASSGATSVFASFDYLRERQTATAYEAGRHSSGYGALLGVDHRFGTKVLAGIAARYAGQSGTLESGGDFATHAPGLRVYGSWLPVGSFFIDSAVGLDRKGADTHRTVALQVITFGAPGYPGNVSYNPPPSTARSHTHERDLTGEGHMGYDFPLSSLTIGPRAAVTFAHAGLDAYTETGTTPMTLTINAQTRTSLRSMGGFQAMRAINLSTGVLVPQLNADWVHEYRDDQRLLSARFAEDLRPQPVEFHFLNNAPDRDWFVVRVAAVAVFPHGFSAFAAFERTAGNFLIERDQASLGVRLER